jgi:hypothetical protein
VDLANNKSFDVTRVITYSTIGALTVRINGQGETSPDLNGRTLELGKIYTLEARPARGYIFLGWEGAFPTNNPKLSFQMISNLNLKATFVPNPFTAIVGTYSGVFLDADTNRFRPESAGYFRLQLANSGSFSGKATLQEGSYSFHGKFDLHGNAEVSINRHALPPITFELLLDLTNGTGAITATATTGSNGSLLTSYLLAERNVFSASQNPAALAGAHSFLLVNPAGGPQTVVTGTATVNTSGSVQIRGSLSTGQSFSVGSALFEDGSVPLFVSVGKGADVFAGSLSLDPGAAIAGEGQIYWVHASSSAVVLLQQTSP